MLVQSGLDIFEVGQKFNDWIGQQIVQLVDSLKVLRLDQAEMGVLEVLAISGKGKRQLTTATFRHCDK